MCFTCQKNEVKANHSQNCQLVVVGNDEVIGEACMILPSAEGSKHEGMRTEGGEAKQHSAHQIMPCVIAASEVR